MAHFRSLDPDEWARGPFLEAVLHDHSRLVIGEAPTFLETGGRVSEI
jgi:hypothetical protein